MSPARQDKRARRSALALCMLAGVALTSCNSAASNPDATIRRAYAWYVQTLKSGRDPLQNARTGLRPLATDRFLTSMANVHSELEGSALIDPQSFDARLAVENVHIRGPAATARVVLTGRTFGRQTLNVYLIKEESGWKIDDVKLIDQASSSF